VAFIGPVAWLDGCAPPEAIPGLDPGCFPIGGAHSWELGLEAALVFHPHVTVLFGPESLPPELLRQAPGTTLGIHLGDGSGADEVQLESIDRLVAFRPTLSGSAIGGSDVWRAIPPPVSDALFGEVRPLHRAPRALSIGCSSAHREQMLLPAKHHHDLLHVIHGVSGEPMRELLRECDVGVFVARQVGGGFGAQVSMHLAAGHLLLAENLTPSHGLEQGIDYLPVDSADSLVRQLDRLVRFPEMHQRIRVRGRLKAEQYRASRLFSRLVHDLLADVAAFGAASRAV
jgi:hypothetical protein